MSDGLWDRNERINYLEFDGIKALPELRREGGGGMNEKEYLLTENQIYEYIQMLHGAAADEHAASCEYVTIYDLHEWLKAHEYHERTCTFEWCVFDGGDSAQDEGWNCSVCGEVDMNIDDEPVYCPNCGAKVVPVM